MERDSMVLLMYLACLELPEGEGIEIEPDLWYYRTRHPASLFHHKLALTYPDTRVTQAVSGFDLLRVVEQAQLTGMLWHVDGLTVCLTTGSMPCMMKRSGSAVRTTL